MPEHMRGDDTLGGQEGSDYQYTHRNKRSITLNLKEAEGIAVLKKLVGDRRRAAREFPPRREDAPRHRLRDALEDQPAPRLREHLGLRPDRPATRRAPASTRSRRAWAASCRSPGLPGQGPVRVGIPIADLCAGIFAAYGVTGRAARARGLGQGPVAAHVAAGSDDLHDGFPDLALDDRRRDPGQAGNFHPTSIPTGVYKTKDGYINIAVFGGKIWERFAEVMGAPEWITDERSKTKAARSVQPRLAQRRDREAPRRARPATTGSRQLNAGGVACGRINNLKEVFEEPQVKHLGMLKKVISPRLGEQTLMGQPVHARRARPRTIARAAPQARRAHRGDPAPSSATTPTSSRA